MNSANAAAIEAPGPSNLDAPPPPDLAAIKRRQQATWASGDYHMIGTQIAIVAELLIEALDLHSTERMLDVATGSGNAAMAAARRGCTVVGLDFVPALLIRARRRAEADGLEADFVAGDAEDLAFDAVGESGRDSLQADLLNLIAKFNRAEDGTMIVPTEYLETVIIKR